MRIGIEMAVSMVLIVVGVVTVFGVYSTAVTAGEAKQYCHQMIGELERQDFAKESYSAYKTKAKEAGYSVDFGTVTQHGRQLMKVTLTYSVALPLLRKTRKYHITGYSVIEGGDRT